MGRPRDIDTWVLAGQSNMQGRGWLEGALAPDERVWCFTMKGTWEPAREPLHRLWESYAPVHQEILRAGLSLEEQALSDAEFARRDELDPCGAGLGMSFGIAMADALGRPVGLIPAAHGGTRLEQWSEQHKSEGLHSLYGAMLDRIGRAGGRLRGVLWYQGESDAASLEDSVTYAARFDFWIAALRADTGIPDLPVVAIQIGRVLEPADRAGLWPGWDMVREALATSSSCAPHVAVTSSVDLPLGDPIHVSTQGLIRLGRRCARLALGLAEGRSAPEGPSVASIERECGPGGVRSVLRVRFRNVVGGWSRTDAIRGFEARLPDAANVEPLFVVNAAVDRHDPGHSVLVHLNRDPGPAVSLGYGLGIDPCCDLVDQADMPLGAFLPRVR